jgi:hypothetical protein
MDYHRIVDGAKVRQKAETAKRFRKKVMDWGKKRQKKSERASFWAYPLYHPWRNGYLPIHADSDGSYLMSLGSDAPSRATGRPTFKHFREHHLSVVVPN